MNPQEQGQQPPQEAGPPKYFQDFTRDLGGVLAQQNAAIARLSQERAPAAPAKPAAPADPTPFRQQIHDRFLNEPERLFAETIAFAEQRADEKIQRTAAEMRQQLEQERIGERLWGEFWAANPDVQAFPAEIREAFARTPQMHGDPLTDFSMRANAARDSVRERMQLIAEGAKQNAAQAQANRRAMAGAPGASFGAPAREEMQQRAQSDMERTARAVAERDAWRKRGDAYNKSGDELRRARAAASAGRAA